MELRRKAGPLRCLDGVDGGVGRHRGHSAGSREPLRRNLGDRTLRNGLPPADGGVLFGCRSGVGSLEGAVPLVHGGRDHGRRPGAGCVSGSLRLQWHMAVHRRRTGGLADRVSATPRAWFGQPSGFLRRITGRGAAGRRVSDRIRVFAPVGRPGLLDEGHGGRLPRCREEHRGGGYRTAGLFPANRRRGGNLDPSA